MIVGSRFRPAPRGDASQAWIGSGRPLQTELLEVDPFEAALPGRSLAGHLAEPAVLDGPDLPGPAVQRGRDRHAIAGDIQAASGDPRVRVDHRGGRPVERHAVRKVAASVTDDDGELLVRQPRRSRRLLRHEEVAPRPLTDRAIQLGRQLARGTRWKVHHPQRGRCLIRGIVDVGADEGQPAAIGRERRTVGVAGEAGQLANTRLRRIGPDRPDLQSGTDRRVRAAVGSEGDPPTIGRPCRMEDVEVSDGQLSRRRAGTERHQPQVRAAHDVPGLVVAEIEPRDATRDRRAPLPFLADDEAVVAGLGLEREARAVRRPVDRSDAVLQRGQLPRLATVERQDPGLGDRVVFADRGPDEGHVPPVRGDRRRAVPHPSAGELPRPSAAIRAHPYVRLVVLATHAPQDVDDARPVGQEAKCLEGDLGSDQRRWDCIGHRFRVCTDSGTKRASLTRFRGMCHSPRV